MGRGTLTASKGTKGDKDDKKKWELTNIKNDDGSLYSNPAYPHIYVTGNLRQDGKTKFSDQQGVHVEISDIALDGTISADKLYAFAIDHIGPNNAGGPWSLGAPNYGTGQTFTSLTAIKLMRLHLVTWAYYDNPNSGITLKLSVIDSNGNVGELLEEITYAVTSAEHVYLKSVKQPTLQAGTKYQIMLSKTNMNEPGHGVWSVTNIKGETVGQMALSGIPVEY